MLLVAIATTCQPGERERSAIPEFRFWPGRSEFCGREFDSGSSVRVRSNRDPLRKSFRIPTNNNNDDILVIL